MAGKIKGITIEFGGNTQKLRTALTEVNKDVKQTQKELNEVNKALKFDPKNTELLKEKQRLLGEQITNNKQRIEDFKTIQEQLKASGLDENSKEWQDLTVQIEKAKKELENTTKQSEKLNFEMSKLGKIGSSLESVGKASTKLGNELSGVSTAAAGALMGIGALTVKSASFADDILTASKITHLNTTELQQMAYASELVDVSQETMFGSLKKLTKSMGDAANGGKRQSEVFDTLGISLTNANGITKTSKQVFDEVIDALGKVENTAERDALAMELFGKSATELNPLIEQGSDAFNKFSESAQNIIPEDELNKMGEYDDAIQQLKADTTAMGVQLGGMFAQDLLPVLNALKDVVNDIAGSFQNLSPEVRKVILVVLAVVASIAPILLIFGKLASSLSAIIKIVPILTKVFASISSAIGLPIVAIGALIAALAYTFIKSEEFRNQLSSVFSGFLTIFTNVIDFFKNIFTGDIEGAFANLGTAITTAFSIIPTMLMMPLEIIKTVLGDFLGFIGNLIGADLKTPFVDFISFYQNVFGLAFSTVISTLTAVFTNFGTTMSAVWANITDIFQGVIDFINGVFTGNWTQAWNGIVSIFSNIFGGIANLVKAPINAVIDTINGFINGANQIKLPKIMGGGGVNIPLIPKLAIGTDKVLEDGLAYLHKGEQVVPSKVVSGGYSGVTADNIIDALKGATFEIHNHIDMDGRPIADRISYIQGIEMKKNGA